MKRTGRLVAPGSVGERGSRAARSWSWRRDAFLGTALFRLQVLEGEQYADGRREPDA
jgi:hypothetical protein